MERKNRWIRHLWRWGISVCGGLMATLSVASMDAESYCFRVYLKDKGIKEPTEEEFGRYLSEEALKRRSKRGIEISQSDVPISPEYIKEVTSTGGQLVTQSKWMATVVVESGDSLLEERLKNLSIVDSVKCVWNGKKRVEEVKCSDDTTMFVSTETKIAEPYGYAEDQIEMLNGVKLHDGGHRGQGMRVAVIDAGFLHVDKIQAFATMNLIGTRNIAFPGCNIFCEDDHGTRVLSCLAANMPGIMIGTAPEASYLLIKSEDTRGEYPIEEDFYAAALEYADSVGVDVVTSSLGYSQFDTNPTYTQDDLNGKTAFISRVAEEAAEKGMLLFCSAGNEGNHAWQKITFPADAPDVLSVGAVTTGKTRSVFSSIGLTADYRVKPDVMALGTNACVINAAGQIQYANGTSFAAPILAGLGVCLWQALPWLNNEGMMNLIKETASQAGHPDAELGYGIPDMYKAYKKELNGAF